MPAEMTKGTAVSTKADGNVASEPSTSQESQTSTLKTGPAAKVNVRQLSSQLECSPKGLLIWAWLTGLARFPTSHLTFVKTLMCSYEGEAWLGYGDLGLSNQDLKPRAGNFAIWTLHPGYREENNTMHFRDRADITEVLILFSSIIKLGIVLFDI